MIDIEPIITPQPIEIPQHMKKDNIQQQLSTIEIMYIEWIKLNAEACRELVQACQFSAVKEADGWVVKGQRDLVFEYVQSVVKVIQVKNEMPTECSKILTKSGRIEEISQKCQVPIWYQLPFKQPGPQFKVISIRQYSIKILITIA